jgi:dethiobiotin synthetase
MPKSKVIFITATDTGVGKTVAAFVLGVLLKRKGFNVGVMKPVQCAGTDAQFLKRSLKLQDDIKVINPIYAPEPLSPHLAFRRSKIKFDKQRVKDCLRKLCSCHDIVLVEGAGGLMVPLAKGYYNADLIADLKAEGVIISRLGLGTINHTLLTINEARRRRLNIKGIIFCQTKPGTKGVPESTNPQEIEKLSKVKVLGIIPYLKPLTKKNILRQCRNLNISGIHSRR